MKREVNLRFQMFTDVDATLIVDSDLTDEQVMEMIQSESASVPLYEDCDVVSNSDGKVVAEVRTIEFQPQTIQSFELA